MKTLREEDFGWDEQIADVNIGTLDAGRDMWEDSDGYG